MAGGTLLPFTKTPILRILLAGFATLTVLVVLLSYISISRFERVRVAMTDFERKQTQDRDQAYKLRSLVEKIHYEAYVRFITQNSAYKGPDIWGRKIAAFKGELNNHMAEWQGNKLLETGSWAKLEAQITQFLQTVDDPRRFAEQGPDDFRRFGEAYSNFLETVDKQRQEISEKSEELKAGARREIYLTGLTIIALALAVAAITIWEIRRRLRELDRSNRAMVAGREFTRSILDGMVEVLFTLSGEGVITSTNQALRQVVGMTKAQLLGARYAEVFANNPKLVAILDEALRDSKYHKSYAGRVELGREGGRFDLYFSPLSATGQREGLIVTLIDVTEMERAQDELRRQAALAAIGQMTAQVAHEIKNPLGGIKLNLSYLRRKFSDNDEALEVTRDLEAQVDRLHQTVMEINQFARPRELQLRPVNLNDMLDEQLALIGDKIQAKQIKVVRDYQPDLPEGYYDSAEMSKVFINLLLNAVEASADRRRLEVSTRLEPQGMILVRIKDEGSGMNRETLKRLFEPFYTTKRQGTGLGMATAKKVVEQHRGVIEVESEVGRGTTIRVYLPTENGRPSNAYAEAGSARLS